MDRAAAKYYETIITLTAYPEWGELVEELKREIYQIQSNALESSSWDKVCEDRGYAKALAYLINLRDDTKKLIAQDILDNAEV